MTLTAGKYHKLLLVGFYPKEWKSHEVIYSFEFSFILVWKPWKQLVKTDQEKSLCPHLGGSQKKNL